MLCAGPFILPADLAASLWLHWILAPVHPLSPGAWKVLHGFWWCKSYSKQAGTTKSPKSQWLSTMKVHFSLMRHPMPCSLVIPLRVVTPRSRSPPLVALLSFSGSSASSQLTTRDSAGWQGWLLRAGLEVVCPASIHVPLARASLTATHRYKALGNKVAVCQQEESVLVSSRH